MCGGGDDCNGRGQRHMHMYASEDEKSKKEKIPNYMSKVICARAFYHRCFVSKEERFARAPSHARSRRQVEILCSYYSYFLW